MVLLFIAIVAAAASLFSLGCLAGQAGLRRADGAARRAEAPAAREEAAPPVEPPPARHAAPPEAEEEDRAFAALLSYSARVAYGERK